MQSCTSDKNPGYKYWGGKEFGKATTLKIAYKSASATESTQTWNVMSEVKTINGNLEIYSGEQCVGVGRQFDVYISIDETGTRILPASQVSVFLTV